MRHRIVIVEGTVERKSETPEKWEKEREPELSPEMEQFLTRLVASVGFLVIGLIAGGVMIQSVNGALMCGLLGAAWPWFIPSR